MRKRVTFVEHLKKDSLLKNGSGHILMRSAESNKRYMEGLECVPGQQGRKMCRGTHTHVPAGGQHMKTIHVSKSVMSAPFLQHPALTVGQRRYLCSIANVYSTEHMRRQMKQHYLNVLHSCVQSVFGKAVHALSRIGEELWLDPLVKGLALRSVNAAHSAYACFLFSPMFFQHYSLGCGSEQAHEAIKCKLVIKSVLPLFRCLTAIERNVERCQISISTPTDRVIIQFFCRHGITKTHNLHFQESEALQAEFSSHLCPNVLKAPARVLSDMVLHFPVSLEEITLSATPLRVTLRNYHEAGNDHMKMMHTEMSLHPDEFDYFQVGVDSDVTFCLKELRGFLSFAESHCLPVSIHFTAAGKPVCFSMDDMVLEATVVLATLIDSENKGPSQPVGCTAPTSPRCADAAALPAASHEVDSRESQNAPAVMELIPSSQSSPITNQPALMHLLSSDHPDGRDVPDEASAMATPASTMICSLLFRALSSEQDDDGCDGSLPVLACYSDTEDDLEGDYTRSPLL